MLLNRDVTDPECCVRMCTEFGSETEAHAVSTRPAQLSSHFHLLIHFLENGTGKFISVIPEHTILAQTQLPEISTATQSTES